MDCTSNENQCLRNALPLNDDDLSGLSCLVVVVVLLLYVHGKHLRSYRDSQLT